MDPADSPGHWYSLHPQLLQDTSYPGCVKLESLLATLICYITYRTLQHLCSRSPTNVEERLTSSILILPGRLALLPRLDIVLLGAFLRLAPRADDNAPSEVVLAVRAEPLAVGDRVERGVEAFEVPGVVALPNVYASVWSADEPGRKEQAVPYRTPAAHRRRRGPCCR